MKKQFNLQDWLKDKSQKVETKDGRPVRIVCWDAKGTQPIIGLIYDPNKMCDIADSFCENGKYFSFSGSDSAKDLFIVTPDPELSVWELAIAKYRPPTDSKETIQRIAAELLTLAEREIVNRVAKECYKEDFCIEDTVKFNEGYKLGKEVTLKDLPRWKKATGKERFNERMIVLAGDNDLYCTNYAEEGEYYLPFPILDKLPKED